MTVNHGLEEAHSPRILDNGGILPQENGGIDSAFNGSKVAQTNGINIGVTNGIKATQTNGANVSQPEIPSASRYAIPLSQKLAFTPRKLRVITIGAGYSGLIMAHKLQHRYPEMQDMVEHTIFEGRSDVGGTWLVNTYPGVQCDVPAQIYVFTTSYVLGL
jgi:hypothetical protein